MAVLFVDGNNNFLPYTDRVTGWLCNTFAVLLAVMARLAVWKSATNATLIPWKCF